MFSSIKIKSSPLASIDRFFSGIGLGGGTDLKIDTRAKSRPGRDASFKSRFKTSG
ncbi:MAG: hypothetical protein R3D26_24775 [Cyanobacteriota/Melainabacteria group bacterium]